MLFLTRKLNQSITIGDDIKVTITKIKGMTSVSLAIQAPANVKILRSELNKRPRSGNR